MAGTIGYVVSSVLSLVGICALWHGFNRMHKYRVIQDTPRSKIRSMAMGLVEIHGNVLADDYITTPFSQTKCIYYKYEIKEYRIHTTRDSKGRTRTTYSWDTISTSEQRIPFWAKDETGQVYVEPTGAEFNIPAKKVFLQKAGLFGAIGTIVNALKDWDNKKQNTLNVSSWNLTPLDLKLHMTFGNTVGDRKYYEYYIEPNENLFVMGTAANSPGAPNNVLIKKGENEPTFIISDRSEKELLRSLMWQMIGCFVFGGMFFIFGIVFLILLINYPRGT